MKGKQNRLVARTSMLLTSVLMLLTARYQATYADDGDFYKRPALFSTRPDAVHKYTQSVDRFGPVGIGIELTQPAFGMRVKNVEKGSPAAATGKLKAGQIIETINGQPLKDIDPRIQLGNIITKAEATDGKIVLAVRDNKNAPIQEVTVTIPVLGAYSDTWPLNCPKSEKIVRNLAARFKEEGHSGNIGMDGPKILFMLSTGEEQDLEVARRWVKKIVRRNKNYKKNGLPYQWHVSWGAPPVAEYYLRTGDESVLPLMQNIADAVKKTQYQGGWGGRGLAGHHMGLAGTGTLTFLLLAKQCGVDVDEDMLQSALEHYYRFAGRGTNPYMDHPPESTFTDNGRNARLAFAMAAASRLRPEGEDSLYADARDISALKSFYSTSYMLHGHTGGGIGEVWRSAGMGLMHEKKPHHYREFMDQRTWFYDLSRRYNGSFGIVGGGGRYDKTSWGITMGLTYTAPRKNLCIFGAPPSKYAKTHDAVPYRPWGNEADDAFLSIQPPAGPDGKVRNLDDERVATDTGLPVNRKLKNPEVSDAEILKYIYHPEFQLRATAASAIARHKRYHLIPDLLKDDDPRVRNAGVSACNAKLFLDDKPAKGFPKEEMRTRIMEMLNDPDEAWFTTYKVLGVIQKFPVAQLAPHIDRFTELIGHREWWLRHHALEAMTPLAADARTYKKALAAIEEHVPNFIRWNWTFWSKADLLKDAEPEVQKAFRETLGRIYLAYPGPKAQNPPGGVHPNSETEFINGLASMIAKLPGGLETLYTVASKRHPKTTLPHRRQFLSQDVSKVQNKELRSALKKIIKDEMIPQYVGQKWDSLKAGIESGNASAIGGLQRLYSRVGIKKYNWQDYAIDRDEMWYYHSFDPPEKWEGRSDRLGRYRKVTFPDGMGNWYALDFDPAKHGWKRGKAPFGAADGKKGYISEAVSGSEHICGLSFCRCGEKINTLWEDDVILIRETFKVAPLEDGYFYRLLHGGISHVGSGGGYRLYINGKLFYEDKTGVDRRGGGNPEGKVITKEWWPEFADGEVTLAAISFKKHHPRTKQYGGNITIFMQRMKVPPLNAKTLQKFAESTLMLTSEWQALQDPERIIDNPDEGKFAWDGNFEPNPKVVGKWKAVDQVEAINDFEPGKSKSTKRLPFSTLHINENGKTQNAQLIWSGEMLMDLDRKQALRMRVEIIDGTKYLFVEAGGFSKKRPAGWECPWVVLKRQ